MTHLIKHIKKYIQPLKINYKFNSKLFSTTLHKLIASNLEDSNNISINNNESHKIIIKKLDYITALNDRIEAHNIENLSQIKYIVRTNQDIIKTGTQTLLWAIPLNNIFLYFILG